MNTNKNQVVKVFLAGLTAAVFLGAGFAPAHAAVLANYNFQTASPNQNVSTDADPLSTASVFGQTGLTISYADPGFVTGDTISVRATATSMATANGTDYFTFTITPTAGYMLQLSGTAAFTFQYARSTGFGGSQFNWAVRSSLDTYGANIATGATTASGTWFNSSVNLGSQFNLSDSSALSFRIYVWDNGASGTTTYGYLDNVVLNGTVAPVPEPVNVALGVFGFCAVVVGVGGRYLRKRS